jgi:hypothetical protein
MLVRHKESKISPCNYKGMLTKHCHNPDFYAGIRLFVNFLFNYQALTVQLFMYY